MESWGRACCLLLLTMAAVSSGRNATAYFQLAGFQHTPSRPEDALVFFTAATPPLICELERDGYWIGGDRLEADLILESSAANWLYTCSFEGNSTAHINLKLIQKSLPNVFVSTGERTINFNNDALYCFTNSQLPEEYFQLQIQRSKDKRRVKCRLHHLKEDLYLRFPGYPTIVCRKNQPLGYSYLFKLLGIVDDLMECNFQVYLAVRTLYAETEKQLYQSLVGDLSIRSHGGNSDVVCSSHTNLNGTADFQVRLPGGTVYDCSFSNS